MIDEELREKITELIGRQSRGSIEYCRAVASQIHNAYKQAGYVRLTKEQDLPIEPEFYEDWGGESWQVGYLHGQQDMLKENFRRIEQEDL